MKAYVAFHMNNDYPAVVDGREIDAYVSHDFAIYEMDGDYWTSGNLFFRGNVTFVRSNEEDPIMHLFGDLFGDLENVPVEESSLLGRARIALQYVPDKVLNGSEDRPVAFYI